MDYIRHNCLWYISPNIEYANYFLEIMNQPLLSVLLFDYLPVHLVRARHACLRARDLMRLQIWHPAEKCIWYGGWGLWAGWGWGWGGRFVWCCYEIIFYMFDYISWDVFLFSVLQEWISHTELRDPNPNPAKYVLQLHETTDYMCGGATIQHICDQILSFKLKLEHNNLSPFNDRTV